MPDYIVAMAVGATIGMAVVELVEWTMTGKFMRFMRKIF